MILVVAGAAALLLRARLQAPEHLTGNPTHDERTVLDSLKATDARHDWESTLLWVERLAPLRPRDPGVLLALGTAWSNYAVEPGPRRVYARTAQRTSLDRMECLRRALGLMDSSARLARGPADWVDSRARLAEVYENLGLPGDALIIYQSIQQRAPGAGRAARGPLLHARLHDPVAPDTGSAR